MEGIEVRAPMRARAGLTDLDRGSDDRLSDDVPQGPRPGGTRGPLEGGPTHARPLARRATGRTSEGGRDVVAERELIRAAVAREHHRRARRRPLLSWFA
jgi:hypothetical protein